MLKTQSFREALELGTFRAVAFLLLCMPSPAFSKGSSEECVHENRKPQLSSIVMMQEVWARAECQECPRKAVFQQGHVCNTLEG